MTVIERWAIRQPPTFPFEQGVCPVRAVEQTSHVFKDEVEVVSATTHQGAVKALERFGGHIDGCAAREKRGLCDCGWVEAAKSLGLFGGR